METAHAFGLWEAAPINVNDMLLSWSKLSLRLNEVSQALGRQDAYPFIINPVVAEKLSYIGRLIEESTGATTTA